MPLMLGAALVSLTSASPLHYLLAGEDYMKNSFLTEFSKPILDAVIPYYPEFSYELEASFTPEISTEATPCAYTDEPSITFRPLPDVSYTQEASLSPYDTPSDISSREAKPTPEVILKPTYSYDPHPHVLHYPESKPPPNRYLKKTSYVKSTPVGSNAPSCDCTCRFEFCGKQTGFKVSGVTDKPFTGKICSKGHEVIGTIDESGEAHLIDHKISKISKLIFPGLQQRFSPSFFKTFTVDDQKNSGVGHEVAQTNQAQFLDNKCWALPIRGYQVLNAEGNVVDEKHPRGNPLHDCVCFTTHI